MKIYGSTEYFDREKQTETFLELYVISQWNFSEKGLCRKPLSDGTMISYGIRQGCPFKILKEEDITEEIKNKLKKIGYSIN